jgi:Flp pilus assembly protein TadD
LPPLGLGNVAAARGDWREAERWYRTALEASPATAAALNNRAEALGRLGCNALARRVLQEGMANIAAGDVLRPTLEDTARGLEANARDVDPAHCSQFTFH